MQNKVKRSKVRKAAVKHRGKMSGRLLAAILMVCLGITAVPVSVHAERPDLSTFFMSGDWAYGTCGSNEVYIGGYAGTDTALVIPDEIEGKVVTEIFQSAFEGDTDLESISIPATVENIDELAFSGCSNLKTVIIREDAENEHDTFQIQAEAFMDCTSLETFAFPASTSKIGERAFSGCIGLTELYLPDSGTRIKLGDYAFFGCEGLTEIVIPKSIDFELESLYGNYAFAQCVNVTTVTLEDGVKNISEGMFSGCEKLESITIPDSVAGIGANAFINCSGLSEIELPNSIIYINDGAFQNCWGLEAVTVPDSVTVIGDAAFAECSGLQSVTLSANLQYIWEEAFLNCTALDNVTIPNGTIAIGSRAFSGCSSLKRISIPASVKDLYEDVLADCNADLTIYTTQDAQTVILYAENGQESPISLGYEEKQEEDYITDGNWKYQIKDDDTAVIIKYTGEEEDIEIPDTFDGHSVSEIGDYAFLRNDDIRKITVPYGVTRIGDSAFNSCVSFMIRIPETVTEISSSAFTGCLSFTIYTVAGADEVISYAIEKNIEYVIPVTDIKFSIEALTLPEGEDTTFGVTITPDITTNRILEWSSSDPDVADVDSEGMITAIKKGTATITASSKDTMAGTTVTASCVVTVTEAVTDEKDQEDDEPGGGNPIQSDSGQQDPEQSDSGQLDPIQQQQTQQQSAQESGSSDITVPTVAKIKNLKVTAKKKQLVISWKKAAGVSGYQIQVSTKSSFKGAKTIGIKSSKTKYTASKLKAKKKYYVRIRAYKTYKDAKGKSQKAYGKWVVKNKKTK